jgi:hypothetical protein
MVSSLSVSYPYGPAFAGRGLLIRRQVIERAGSAAWHLKDISDARWEYRVRAWDPAAAAPAFLFDEVCAKSATDAADGWLDHYLELGDAARPTLAWEIVEVDRAAPAAKPTRSGFREVVLEAWWQAVGGAPVA